MGFVQSIIDLRNIDIKYARLYDQTNFKITMFINFNTFSIHLFPENNFQKVLLYTYNYRTVLIFLAKQNDLTYFKLKLNLKCIYIPENY